LRSSRPKSTRYTAKQLGVERFRAIDVADPSEAPPPALLKLFKALSDEGRLRLLRRLSAGPISLTEAAGELDVAKATAHHHLAILYWILLPAVCAAQTAGLHPPIPYRISQQDQAKQTST
jgi:hypothetical protein